MIKYFIKRLGQLVVVIFIVSILVFILTSVIGDPVFLLVQEDASPEEIAAARAYLGLDKPLYHQYVIFAANALKGDFGRSYMYHQSALKMIAERFPATLEIVFVAMTLTFIFGIGFGVYSGAYPKRRSSHMVMFSSIVGISLPSFWLGMVLIYLLGLKMGLFPVSGRGTIGVIFGVRTSLATLNGWRHVFLPALTLSMGRIASILRLTRAGMQENMKQDYVKFARAKGLGNRRVLFGHALKNTLIPVVTIFGLQMGSLIAFTTITETIFSWPGMGKLIIDSIRAADRPIISAYILFVAVMFVGINFIVDILYTVIDPRIRMK